MTAIDMRIIFAEYVLSIFLCLIVVFFLWWQNRKRSPEIALWLADYVLQFTAILLIALRGILPDFLTIVVAQIFIIGGTIILYEGLCRYVGKECRQTHNYVMLAIFTLVHIYLTYTYPHMGLRTVNFAIALFYICAQGVWLMLRRVELPLRQATTPAGIVFAAFCIVNAIQAVVNLTLPPSGNIFVSGLIGIIAILVYETLFIALTFTLFLLVSRRLAIELEGELIQRAQTEEELIQSQEKFAKAFQTSPYAIAITQMKDGKFLDINDAFTTITGYSKEEVLARSSIGLKLWENEKDREDMVSILRQGLPVVEKEYKFRKKNGEVLTGLFSAQIVKITEEPCLLSSIEDITERKQAEKTLKRNEGFLNSLLNAIPLPVFYKDEQGRYLGFNRAFEDFFGSTKEQLVGKSVFDINPPELAKIYHAKDKDLLDKGGEQFYESQVRNTAGEARDVLFNKAVFTDDRGNVKGLIGTILDITERKQADRAIRESEERIRAITNSAKDAITMMDNLGNISYWNPAAETIFGYTRAEAIGKNLHELLAPPRFLPAYFSALPEFKKTGKGNALGKTIELAALRKDGREIDIALSLSAVKIKEEWHAVGIIQDITERKKVENALRESEERYRFIANHTADHIWVMDLDMRFTYSSPSVMNTLGFTPEEFMTKNINEFFASESLMTAQKIMREELAEESNPEADPNRSRTLESEHYRKDGKTVWLESSLTFVRDASLKPIGIMGVSRDITERKLAEKLIRVRLSLFEFAATHPLDELLQKTLDDVGPLVESPIGFYHFVETDQKTLALQAWSTRTVKDFCKATGEGMHYGIDQAGVWVDCVHEKRPVIHNDYMSLPHRKGLPEGHAPVIRELVVPIMRNGKVMAILGVGNKDVDYNEKDVEIVSYLADVAWEIAERKRDEERIKHMSTHDLLTDLPSLSLAKDRLTSAMNMARRYKKSVAVMFIDLDGFKTVNDTLGHDAGDYVLKQVAQRMLSCVRETDTVARVGGDEFLIIATEINSPENAAQIAEKVVQSVPQPVSYQGQQAVVGTSIGIALFPEHGDNMDQLIKLADEAMYKVKNAGKNNFRFVHSQIKV
jgi:diguanylate cyclase (GGDEF)-like protein/PAS domain S-box-containing protein